MPIPGHPSVTDLPAPLWEPSPRGRRPRASVAGAPGGASPPTRRPGSWSIDLTSGHSGGRLRTVSRSGGRPPDGDRCRIPPRMTGWRWFRRRPAQLRRGGPAAAAGGGASPAVVGRSQTRPPQECAGRAHRPGGPGGWGGSTPGCGNGDGWPPTYPTSPRRWRRSSPPPAWERSGPPARRSSASPQPWTGSPRPSPMVLLALTATVTAPQTSSRTTTPGASSPASPRWAAVRLPYLQPVPPRGGVVGVGRFTSAGDARVRQVGFDHPLYILFSSGTTGRPKAIVHSHGGMLLEHLKALGFHFDLGRATASSGSPPPAG